MGSFLYLTFILLTLKSLPSIKTKPQHIKSAHLLDLLIRDYTFKSLEKQQFIKTGVLYTVNLPANFTGIKVDTMRLRCGSLTRYGARVKEFRIGIGVTVQPCAERVIIIRQSLNLNTSSVYFTDYNLSGFKLISPVLSLLAYNSGVNGPNGVNYSNNPFEIQILSGGNPITIDFRNATATYGDDDEEEAKIDPKCARFDPKCARFDKNGKVTLRNLVSPYVCDAERDGHYGLVVESPEKESPGMEPSRVVERKRRRREVRGWIMAAVISIVSVVGASLLGLLFMAMIVNGKKKAKREESERRAYEDEALRISMVGHVRAPVASGTRTVPTIEYRYPNYSS